MRKYMRLVFPCRGPCSLASYHIWMYLLLVWSLFWKSSINVIGGQRSILDFWLKILSWVLSSDCLLILHKNVIDIFFSSSWSEFCASCRALWSCIILKGRLFLVTIRDRIYSIYRLIIGTLANNVGVSRFSINITDIHFVS